MVSSKKWSIKASSVVYFLLIVMSASIVNATELKINAEIQEALRVKADWTPYPKDLPQFDYSGDKLRENWEFLSTGIQLPWPDAAFMRNMMESHPPISLYLIATAKQPNAHPALVAVLNDNYQPLAAAMQQIWRFHYQGDFQESYELGIKLGPIGILPALYSKLIHNTFLVKSNEEKAQRYLDVSKITTEIISLAPEYLFLIFADVYQKTRRLEMLSTADSLSSGLVSKSQDAIRKLHREKPTNVLYAAFLAAFDAGVIERVGNFVGSVTYGTDEDRAIKLFIQSIVSAPHLAVLYNEYAQIMIRLDENGYKNKISRVLNDCLDIEVFSAEEALNQQQCQIKITSLQ
jgi:hypothetical protein